jgi:hypothetical protein
VLITGGGAAGSVAYVAFEVTAAPGSSGGGLDVVHPVLVASFAADVYGVDAFHDDDPHPGVFAAVDGGLAEFVSWCPACDASWASLLTAAGNPAIVSERVPVATKGNPSAPSGISFVDAQNGWVLFENGLLLITEDGGQTWFDPCDRSACPGVAVPAP